MGLGTKVRLAPAGSMAMETSGLAKAAAAERLTGVPQSEEWKRAGAQAAATAFDLAAMATAFDPAATAIAFDLARPRAAPSDRQPERAGQAQSRWKHGKACVILGLDEPPAFGRELGERRARAGVAEGAS